MRTIKFRAWHKEEKLMIPEVLAWVNNPSTQYIKFAKIKDYQGNPLNNPTFANLDQVELMQFTGLLDKNGKEIFEGDILRIKPNPKDYGGYKGHNYIAAVKWDQDEARYYLSQGESDEGELCIDTTWLFLKEDIKIIGNIYENKNLLNREDG